MDNIIPQDTPQKQCYDCKQFKPFTSFKKDKHRPNGIKGICKECHNAKGRDAYTPKVRPTLPEGMKRCSVCKELKPATLEYFSTNKIMRDGLRSSCKPCSKAQEARNCYLNGGNVKQEKRCPDCKETKSIEEFSLSKTRYDGRQSLCKACAHLRYVQRHPKPEPPDTTQRKCNICGEVKPAAAEFFAKKLNGLQAVCKVCRSAQRRQPERRAKDLANERWYNARNRERIKLVSAQRRARNRDHVNAVHRRWVASHSEQQNARRRKYHAQYRVTHRAKIAAYGHNRRAASKSIPGKHTGAQILEQYQRQHKKCYYCRNRVKWGKHHVDHTFPISRVAGMGIPANSIEYLVITCAHCNLSKKDKFPWEWAEGNRLL